MTRRDLAAVFFGGRELDQVPLKLLSLGLLVTALVCAWLPHSETYFWYWQAQVSFTPDFVSGALALAVIAPLYARRIIPYPHHSVNGILFFIVNLSLTATFIQVALGKGTGLTTAPAIAIIVAAIALSWLGMRAAAGLAWLGLLAFSVISTVFSNIGWGIAGFGFVVCGFCGVLLQTPLSPSLLIAEIAQEYGTRKDRFVLPPRQEADRLPN